MEGRKGESARHISISAVANNGLNLDVKNKQSLTDHPKTVGDYITPNIDDPQLDKAINDIVIAESNEVLLAEDQTLESLENQNRPKKKRHSLKRTFKSKWLYIGLGLVIIAIFAVPYSRYMILGQFMKNRYPLTITDSVTHTPVSGAIITVGKQKAETNASGQTDLNLPLGKRKVTVTKQYYANYSGYIFVGFTKNKGETVKLFATGRRVPILIVNKLTGDPISGAKISILNTSAYTNTSGQAQIVLPTKKSSYEADVTMNGYTSLMMPIKVSTSKGVNNIKLVPNGSIYYLSDATGTINVIKANLDGSDPTIALAGTGKETSSTVLMPSPDWQYLFLEANRSGSTELYMVNTSTGDLTEFDSANDNFTPIGWSDDQFIYDEINPSADTSVIGREQIKSYDPVNDSLNVLDQDQVEGSSPSYAYQSFANFELLPNQLIYTTNWNSVDSYDISTSNDTIRGVEPNGLNKEDYQSFNASTTGTVTVIRSELAAVYFSVPNTSTNQTSYYQYDNGAVNTATSANLTAKYPKYYLSPSGSESLWLSNHIAYVGNENGQDGKKIPLPAGYSLDGWYDNLYILLTQGNELYIAPASGTKTPTLIGTFMPSG